MTRLGARLDRLEHEGGRFCTIGEIFDADDAAQGGKLWSALKPISPQLKALLAKLENIQLD
ncbi:hypothetical protein [Novosphingobium rosa]|uniref:hypothetical protein n=1 Tax=Novosphingobium rosa TaxID=76978 RepID=UPI00083253EE|nr:hypothetical protein [Novosphingobium rosa]